MAAMTSKFNFECVIQYYTDQWIHHLNISNWFTRSHPSEGDVTAEIQESFLN